MIPDEVATEDGDLRVIDESGDEVSTCYYHCVQTMKNKGKQMLDDICGQESLDLLDSFVPSKWSILTVSSVLSNLLPLAPTFYEP